MSLPSDIPEDIADRAAILMDELRHIKDDLEFTARVIMAVAEGRGFGLSEKQADALAFIETFSEEKGYSPSYAEIQEGLGLGSKSGAHGIVQRLIKRGALRQLPNRYRSLVVVKNRDVSAAHKNSEVA
ncbi:LexA family protein [Devosia sp.]|uniref:LexA family protein n=1 Tax=Devosia sp. TaxID=1871048 RepID=UPI001B14E15F|nr:hypothetical protein [Devosia sp.]